MAGPPSAQDVADALAITLERHDASGAPWCPPRDASALRRWITDRSAPLGGGIRRVVRLVRVMAIADGRDYMRFLYVRLTALRTRHFRFHLQTAVTEGRLPTGVAILSETSLLLMEPVFAPQAEAREQFEIDFAQMPRLGALLDFLHNALGFAAVADLLAPLLQQGALPGSADEVARRLHAALNVWLSDRLESANHIRQAQRIRSFLASRGRVAPEAIDDESILLFWMMIALYADDDRIEGFRLYRSAASAMLRYRQAVRDALIGRSLEKSLGRGLETGTGERPTDLIEVADASIEPWQSPLRALALPPANRVKWLTVREQRRLLNYLGGPGDDGELQEPGDEEQSWKGGLTGDERFDSAFWLTLLRADVFGAVQASIVARLRKRAAANDAIAQAMEAVNDAAYTTSATAYADLREQLRIECLAALAALMEAGAAEAVILLDHLGSPQFVASVIGGKASSVASLAEEEGTVEALRKEIAPALRAALADPNSVPGDGVRELLLEARAATRKVGRIGFRREDNADPEMLAALRSGVAALVESAREVERLLDTLSHKASLGDVAGDRDRFLATFRHIYLPN